MSHTFSSILKGTYTYEDQFESIPNSTKKAFNNNFHLFYQGESFICACWSDNILNRNKIFLVITSQRVLIKIMNEKHECYLNSISGINENIVGNISLMTGASSIPVFSSSYGPTKALVKIILKELNQAIFNSKTIKVDPSKEEYTKDQDEQPIRAKPSKPKPLQIPKLRKWYEKKRNLIPAVITIFYFIFSVSNQEKDSENKAMSNEVDSTYYDSNGRPITLERKQFIEDSIWFSSPEYQEKLEVERLERMEQDIKDDCTFNAYNGSFYMLNKYIKDRMNDPDSFDHIQTTSTVKNDYIEAIVSFRGKNSFGGVVKSTVVCRLYSGCKVVLIK